MEKCSRCTAPKKRIKLKIYTNVVGALHLYLKAQAGATTFV